MSIPVFVSEIRAVATDVVGGNGSGFRTIPSTQYYFLISSKSSDGNGKSFLAQLKESVDAASGLSWSFSLTSDLKIKAVHNKGTGTDLQLGRVLAWNLGYPLETLTPYPPDPTQLITL